MIQLQNKYYFDCTAGNKRSTPMLSRAPIVANLNAALVLHAGRRASLTNVQTQQTKKTYQAYPI